MKAAELQDQKNQFNLQRALQDQQNQFNLQKVKFNKTSESPKKNQSNQYDTSSTQQSCSSQKDTSPQKSFLQSYVSQIQSQPKNEQSKNNLFNNLLFPQLPQKLSKTMKNDDQSQNQYKINEKKQNISDKQTNKQVKLQYQRKIQLNKDRRQRVCNILKDLYSNTSGLRNVEDQYKYYVREIENESAFSHNYSLNLKNKTIVGKVCNAIIQVRGDGNCFYTAFGFQFLYHLLFSYTDLEFDEFIKKILDEQIRFGIKYVRKQIDDEQIEKDCLEEFIYLIEDLRQEEKEKRFEKFRQRFANWQINENGDGFLYCLQTIFFRNLSYQYLEQSDFKDIVLDKENLLIWEEECNTNEVIIKLLAQELKIHTKLLFLDDEVTIREYEEENKNTIILLIKPGHYNIGWKIPAQ